MHRGDVATLSFDTGLAEMSDASKAGIFETILGDFLASFSPAISQLCAGLVQSTIDTFNNVLTRRPNLNFGKMASFDAGRVVTAPDAGQVPLHLQSAGPRESVSRNTHGKPEVH